MKVCTDCQKLLPHEAFAKNASKSDGLQNKCKECKKLYNITYYSVNKDRHKETRAESRQRIRDENTAKMVELLRNSECMDCGNSDIRVLEFDHLGDKSFTIGGRFQSMSWDRVLTEIEKCDIVCANCHKIRTAERANNYRHNASVANTGLAPDS